MVAGKSETQNTLVILQSYSERGTFYPLLEVEPSKLVEFFRIPFTGTFIKFSAITR